MDAVGFDATISPNGKLIAFTRGISIIYRKDYKGSSDRNIWIYDIAGHSYQAIRFETNDILPQWAGNDELYFSEQHR